MLAPPVRLFLALLTAMAVATAQSPSSSVQQLLAMEIRALDIQSTWQVLGPFQIGTREAVWGADPLAVLGGFTSLKYALNASVASSLAPNGAAGWSEHSFEPTISSTDRVGVELDVAFPSVDWRNFKDVYGWAALQAQAWARTSFEVLGPDLQNIAVYTDNVLEFAIDGQQYFGGDFFSYRRAPLILELGPGHHTIELRLTRDARASGAVGHNPTLQANIELRVVRGSLQSYVEQSIIPDVINGKFTAAYGSISLQNTCANALDIVHVEALDSTDTVSLLSQSDHKIEPGQSRPIALRLAGDNLTQSSLTLSITYRLHHSKELVSKFQTSIPLRHRAIKEAHLFTYLHPSGIVSRAVIRPPGQSAQHFTGKLPVLVNLHGAGVAVDTPQLMQSLDEVSHLPTWFVFPSGVTTWCGDDWHHWGWGDSQAAIAAVPEWLKHNHWQGPGVDTSRLFVIGHSNGGQGVLHATTHWPDLIIAAASASGYLSIQSYVPFQLWHEADPLRLAVAHAATNDFRHELLVSNAKDIPIFLQHGTEDDNVPPYHSRRLGQLLQENAIAANYSEQKGKGHWWEGAQVTQELRDFYSAHIADPRPVDTPSNFSLVVASPSNTGSKRGLRIDRSLMPGQLSKVRVTTVKSEVQIQTSNVLELSITDSWLKNYSIHVDGHKVHVADELTGRLALNRRLDGTWHHEDRHDKSGLDLSNRRLGNGLHAILKTPDRIGIQLRTESARSVAISIAQSLYQYFAADVVLSDLTGEFYEQTGDVITVGIGDSIDPGIMTDYPIKVATDEIIIRDYDGTEHRYGSGEDVGAIFLRPHSNGLLQLVVWGSTAAGLAVARRLVPTITGAGQPDFVVLAYESRFKGLDGALAIGFFDSRWSLTKASFLS